MSNYLVKLSKIDFFCRHHLKDKVYTTDDINVSDLTDSDLKYMREELNLNFVHVCGVLEFYEN